MRHLAAVLSLSLLATSPAIAAASRPGWVEAELYRFNHPLALEQKDEVAAKMEKMKETAFSFYRGTAHLFYLDMANLPPSAYLNAETRRVWINGDLHLLNYGGRRDSAGTDVFDISDFDESYIGPYVWDIRRMAVSIVLAARELTFSPHEQNNLVDHFIDGYLDKLADFKGNGGEKSYRLKADDLSNLARDVVKKVGEGERAELLKEYSDKEDLKEVPTATAGAIRAAMAAYIASIPPDKRQPPAFYTVKETLQRMGSGTGSLGHARYWVLIEGASASPDDDVVLEMKEMGASAVALANPGGFPSAAYGNQEGARVAISNRAGLINVDPLIGSTMIAGKSFFVKERSPFQEGFKYKKLKGHFDDFKASVTAMGKILARTHALADKDYDDALVPFSQEKQITEIITSAQGFKAETRAFAKDYADQVEFDHAALRDALTAKRPLY